jgi:hypothetical protein
MSFIRFQCITDIAIHFDIRLWRISRPNKTFGQTAHASKKVYEI